MNFGEKFPYALLTFSQSLSSWLLGVHLLQKFVEAGYWVHLLPKVVEAGYWGTLHPNHYPHAQLHINSHTPYPIHQLYTHHTLSHNPAHTPPPAS